VRTTLTFRATLNYLHLLDIMSGIQTIMRKGINSPSGTGEEGILLLDVRQNVKEEPLGSSSWVPSLSISLNYPCSSPKVVNVVEARVVRVRIL